MADLFQYLYDNIGAVVGFVGGSAVVQAAISLLIVVVNNLAKAKSNTANIAAAKEAILTEVKSFITLTLADKTDQFKTAVLDVIKLILSGIKADIKSVTDNSLANVNAYIQTILSAAGNEDLRIAFESLRAALATKTQSEQTNTLTFIASVLDATETAEQEPATEEPAQETEAIVEEVQNVVQPVVVAFETPLTVQKENVDYDV